jgi:hypothetical protein
MEVVCSLDYSNCQEKKTASFPVKYLTKMYVSFFTGKVGDLF